MTATVINLAAYRARRAERRDECEGCAQPIDARSRLCIHIDQETGTTRVFCSEACCEINQWINKGMRK